MSARLPYYYQGDGFDGPKSANAMWILSPEMVSRALHCAYEIDSASVQFQCHPWDNNPEDPTDACVPGCHWATSKNLKERWCAGWKPMYWNWEWGIGKPVDFRDGVMVKWDETTFDENGEPDFLPVPSLYLPCTFPVPSLHRRARLPPRLQQIPNQPHHRLPSTGSRRPQPSSQPSCSSCPIVEP
jgi:hypothetical protein